MTPEDEEIVGPCFCRKDIPVDQPCLPCRIDAAIEEAVEKERKRMIDEITTLKEERKGIVDELIGFRKAMWWIAYNEGGEYRISENAMNLLDKENILEWYKDERAKEYVFKSIKEGR